MLADANSEPRMTAIQMTRGYFVLTYPFPGKSAFIRGSEFAPCEPRRPTRYLAQSANGQLRASTAGFVGVGSPARPSAGS